MRIIKQSTIDKIIPEVNGICAVHNRRFPEYPLKPLPTDKRVAHLMDPSEYEEIDESSTAIYDRSSDKILIHKDRIREHVDQSSEIRRHIGLFRYQAQIILLELLNHENVHRSCRTTAMPQELEGQYEAVADFILSEGHPELADKLSSIREAGGRFEVSGLLVGLRTSEGNLLSFGLKDINETLTSFLSVTSMLRYFVEKKRDVIKDYHELYQELFLRMPDTEADDPASYVELGLRLQTHMRNPQYTRLYRDYIHGTSPNSIAHKESEEDKQPGLNAILAQLAGDTRLSPALMDRYGLSGASFELIQKAREEMESLG